MNSIGYILSLILVKKNVRNAINYDSFIKGETVNMTFDQFMTYYRLNPDRYEIKSDELYCLNENEKYKISLKYRDYIRYIKWFVKREEARKDSMIEQNKIELMEDLRMILEGKYSNENPERKEEARNVRC